MIDPLQHFKVALRQWSALAVAPPQELPREPSFAYAVSRFLLSWRRAQNFGSDQAVLLRQCLRWGNLSSLLIGPPPASQHHVLDAISKAGMTWDASGILHLQPFSASWLEDSKNSDAPPVARALDESFAAEAFLESVGYGRWRSQAQKEAAWATLQAPEGSTRVIVLPTGSGKSLCFQLLPRFSSGLTVVVVPTIALAMDQQSNAVRLLGALPGVNPLYFAADDNPEAVALALEKKRTRLIFTSPEACVSGRLRPILDGFAKDGWLANLVVDEAHLIETWGAQFRVEFQILAAARRSWRAETGNKLRTFLFSATMSSPCRETLQKMFSDDVSPREFVCQRLRPEVRYYSRQFADKSLRDAAVLESLWHLPRPAILYVTEKASADEFVALLREQRFSRVESFHGDTCKADRRAILEQWKNNEIDLIVATSAFGVGVDKRDVRAVVHACYPENLDRYYQEVGRGGRDGWSSISLLLASPRDREVAEGITVSLMTPELIQERWAAMFDKAEPRDEYVYALPVAARRMGLVGTRTYRENIRWNKRLLLQLERAGQLKLLDIELRPSEQIDEEPAEWVIVKLAFAPRTPRLSDLIADQRNEEVAYFRSGLEKLDELVSGNVCATRVIGNLYDIASHQRGCPGCPFCRSRGRLPSACEPLDYPKAVSASQLAKSELIEKCPDPRALAGRADFVDAVSRCVSSKGLRHFFCPEQHFAGVLNCFTEAFPVNAHELHRIDPTFSSLKLSSVAGLPAVFFHVGSISAEALAVARGHPTVHLLCGVQNPYDHNDRHVSVNENFRRWPTFESWIAEPPINSLPCLPMTL